MRPRRDHVGNSARWQITPHDGGDGQIGCCGYVGPPVSELESGHQHGKHGGREQRASSKTDLTTPAVSPSFFHTFDAATAAERHAYWSRSRRNPCRNVQVLMKQPFSETTQTRPLEPMWRNATDLMTL